MAYICGCGCVLSAKEVITLDDGDEIDLTAALKPKSRRKKKAM